MVKVRSMKIAADSDLVSSFLGRAEEEYAGGSWGG